MCDRSSLVVVLPSLASMLVHTLTLWTITSDFQILLSACYWRRMMATDRTDDNPWGSETCSRPYSNASKIATARATYSAQLQTGSSPSKSSEH
ncbi:hypothetical protein EDB80DRAFT_254972 [Ilyonectria destructans]|nr:hypothetical protein EDB80DRAFT_254972 [Ilyonectria destructans]